MHVCMNDKDPCTVMRAKMADIVRYLTSSCFSTAVYTAAYSLASTLRMQQRTLLAAVDKHTADLKFYTFVAMSVRELLSCKVNGLKVSHAKQTCSAAITS